MLVTRSEFIALFLVAAVALVGCSRPSTLDTASNTTTSQEDSVTPTTESDDDAGDPKTVSAVTIDKPSTNEDAPSSPTLSSDPGPTPDPPKDDDSGDTTDTLEEADTSAAKPTEVALNPTENTKKDTGKTKPVKRIKVKLGDAQLTVGIPGDGDLTLDQIKKWLDDPENHATLDVELPLGLAAGANSVFIPEDNPMTKAKIELGRQLYFDKRLSSDSSVSCADCHHPDEGYGRATQFGVGVDSQEGNRNSPVSYNRIVSTAQFWDGRAATLEDQAVGPIANPIEMANTHEAAVKTIKELEGYKVQFDAVFGDGVNIDNVGKAIATFERAIVTGPTPYDYNEPLRNFEKQFKDDLEDLESFKEDDPDLFEQYEKIAKAAKAHPMSESAERGRELFFSQRVGCTACHAGANFTDEKYHNLGVGMDADEPDLGRFMETKDEKDKGAFKTPTVRNVVHSAPYMHDGSQKTLEEVVEWYSKGGHPNDHLSDKIKKIDLKDQEKKDLVAFMKALTGDFPKVETGRLPQK